VARSFNRTSGGVLASLGSSFAFAGVYFVTPLLAPAPAESVWGIRNLVTIPVVIIALLAVRQWHLVTEIITRIRRNPLLLLGILACGLLIAAQLWVFTWAPLHGRGLHVALGYFLLPLVLVLVGRFLYRDRLRWWQWLAAGVAALGVLVEIIRVGGVSWETLLVALGYPVYFVVRRAINTNHLAGMLGEFTILAPLALVFVVLEISRGTALTENPSLWWSAPLFAAWTGVALILYVVSSRLLTMSLFGLLSYLEPALLVLASLANGEQITGSEWNIYLMIWTAVLILVAGGTVSVLRSSRKP
jgi:chloramphenicol-sensitive protein RarD